MGVCGRAGGEGFSFVFVPEVASPVVEGLFGGFGGSSSGMGGVFETLLAFLC